MTSLIPGSLGSFQSFAHHGVMATFMTIVRRLDTYTLEVFNPPHVRRRRAR